MANILPQDDKNLKRAGELEGVRKEYEYNYKWEVPVALKYRSRDTDGPQWAVKVFKGLMEARSNAEAILKKTGWKPTNKIPTLSPVDLANYLVKKDFPNLFDFYLTELGPMQGGGRPASLADYQQVFQKVEKTYAADKFMDDEYFAHSFIAGPHSNAFSRMKAIPGNFPLTNEIFQKTKQFASDDLTRAIAGGRVYFADYFELNDLASGVHPLQKKYIYQPIAAFAVPEGGTTMVPFAIQCGQIPAACPIFTPADEWAWQMAKGVAWAAHYTYHEIMTHLGLTHLLIEPIAVATRRQLHEAHPIYALLSPHFEGTMLINNLAMSSLVQDGQAVDRLVGSTNASNFAFLIKGRLSYSFTDNYLPSRLKSRGVSNPKFLPNYHYRDDAIPIWNATRAWVGRFVDRFYRSDADVKADFELQAWAAEINSEKGGRVKDFAANGGVDSKDQLIDTCTMVLFTAGPQHAAVNFPQLTDMSFLPGGPLAGYRSAPENNKMTQNDYLDFLPPMDIAIKQWQTMNFLGSVRHTTYGQYDSDRFKDAAVDAAAKKFLQDLARIEADIKTRNMSRIKYEHLLPSLIPQSTNI